jgi:hypothetical protein
MSHATAQQCSTVMSDDEMNIDDGEVAIKMYLAE